MGIMFFSLGVVANLQYAWGNYGVTSNSLHAEVFAQSCSDSGGGGGGTTGGLYYDKRESSCVYSGKAYPFERIILGDIEFNADEYGNWSYTSEKSGIRCFVNGEELCNPQKCPTVPSGSGTSF
ncbi:hypothetical protein DW103_02450 [Parabacteroides sp. AM08-6]|nr:hypothetical protein DW103_02450 [Parabacteroides sp. AM08-6]